MSTITKILSATNSSTIKEAVTNIRTLSQKQLDSLTKGIYYKTVLNNSEDEELVIRTFLQVKDNNNPNLHQDVYAIDTSLMQVIDLLYYGKTPIYEVKKAFLIDYIKINKEDTDKEDSLKLIEIKSGKWQLI